MAKVFVTQIPVKRDRATGAEAPIFSISPATEHGEVVVMMPSRSHYQPSEGIYAQLRAHLQAYSPERDSLLLIGDSAIIAAAVSLVAVQHGHFSILRWDRVLGRYSRMSFQP